MSLAVVAEGDTDFPYLRKLASDAGFDIAFELDCGGKGDLDSAIAGYNNSAIGSPWLVVRDLDHDAACAADFLTAIAFVGASWMCYRIAVREIESWLLADRKSVASFFSVPESAIPIDPDTEADPTDSIVALSRRSKSRAIREGMVPAPGSGAQVGPLYEALIIEFGTSHWNLNRASGRSDSLRRARNALRRLSRRWQRYVRGEP